MTALFSEALSIFSGTASTNNNYNDGNLVETLAFYLGGKKGLLFWSPILSFNYNGSSVEDHGIAEIDTAFCSSNMCSTTPSTVLGWNHFFVTDANSKLSAAHCQSSIQFPAIFIVFRLLQIFEFGIYLETSILNFRKRSTIQNV